MNTTSAGIVNEAQPERPGWGDLSEIVREVHAARELLYQFILRDVRIRYKQTAMGFAWAIFMPAVIVLAGLIVRYAMAQLSGSPMDTSELAGVAIKSVPWAFFVGALQFGTNSLATNVNLVQKVYFPREILPLSAVCTQAFDSTIGGLAMLLGLIFFGVQFSLYAVWAVPLISMLLLFTFGAALLLSCANLFFRDVKYLVRVVLTFGIFFTPVFLEAPEFGQLGAQLVMLNPVAPVLEGLRLAAIEGHNLLDPLTATLANGDQVVVWHPWYLLYAGGWSLVSVFGASILFHRAEFAFAEYA